MNDIYCFLYIVYWTCFTFHYVLEMGKLDYLFKIETFVYLPKESSKTMIHILQLQKILYQIQKILIPDFPLIRVIQQFASLHCRSQYLGVSLLGCSWVYTECWKLYLIETDFYYLIRKYLSNHLFFYKNIMKFLRIKFFLYNYI